MSLYQGPVDGLILATFYTLRDDKKENKMILFFDGNFASLLPDPQVNNHGTQVI